jgi:hypothetical protein
MNILGTRKKEELDEKDNDWLVFDYGTFAGFHDLSISS